MTIATSFASRFVSTALRVSLIAASALTLSVAAPALAQDAPAYDPDAIIAHINDVTITEADLVYAAEDLAEDLQQIPPQARRAYLTSVLIDMKLMSQAAKGAGLDGSDEFRRRSDYLQEQALRRAYFVEIIDAAITDEAIEQTYNDYLAANPAGEEVSARHILVGTEEEALAVIEEINGGRDFGEVANEKTLDPSGQSTGGNLGYFTRGQMVPEFETAAFALEIGGVSAPVQSQFGWHVIKLEDRRDAVPPTLEQLAPQIRQQLLIEKFEQSVEGLRADANISFVDAAIGEMLANQLPQN